MLVSIPAQGKIVALPDRNNDGKADATITVADRLNQPHGLAFRCDQTCKLYIAETDQVAVYDYDQAKLRTSNKRKLLDLPDDGGHSSRTLLFDQDRLLVAVGSSCNVCEERDERRAAIWKMNPNGSNAQLHARGLRNSVFLTHHPITKQVWATEMGRDLLGDNIPPDEINIIEPDRNYGWPICYGKNIHDTQFDRNRDYIRNPCEEPFEAASHIDLQAHSAPLGLAFVPANSSWPEQYWNDLLVAYHGSWNRSTPTGYKIVRFDLDDRGQVIGEQHDFISGWLKGNQALGRPVDVQIRDDGSMYVTDDKAGVVYRVDYKK
jgi:glucose/arabinose dehydrogenase